MENPIGRAVALSFVLLVVAACSDERAITLEPEVEEEGPAAPAARALSLQLHCAADVRAGSLSCAEPAAVGSPAGVSASVLAASGNSGNLIVGGQGTLVRLESSNVCFGLDCPGSEAPDLFLADVTVQNLMGQALATADGVEPDAKGVRIFFIAEPEVTHGTGTVSVASPDGVAAFTEADQPYIEYGGTASPGALGEDQILVTEEVSAPRTWGWKVSAGVEGFSFTVAVSAVVARTDALDRVMMRPGAIVAGSRHSCALTEDGTAYCWGRALNGVLGHGEDQDASAPVEVLGGHTFTELAAGGTHTCGLRDDGRVYCWGDQNLGRLGNGETSGEANAPVPVGGDLVFTQLTTGDAHNCGLTSEGQAYCWGSNTVGQLGDGTRTSRDAPVPVDQGAVVFTSIVALSGATCALTASGEARCWGSNYYGQLGRDDVTSNYRTTPVTGSGGRTFRALATGSQHVCGLTPGGDTYCWGGGADGQLGNGQTVDSSSSVKVIGGKPEFATVGNFFGTHMCAITFGGAGYCWGGTAYGKLGTDGTTEHTEPGLVVGDLSYSSIAGGSYHTCAITADGDAYCWGYNDYGQVGIGVKGKLFSSPMRVKAPAGVAWKTTP